MTSEGDKDMEADFILYPWENVIVTTNKHPGMSAIHTDDKRRKTSKYLL